MRSIKASELGTYLYCRRAWWFRQQGIEGMNQAELQAGTEFHHRHGTRIRLTGLVRTAGWILLLLGLVFLAAALAAMWTG